jgi:DNA gyrase subunit A
MSEEKIQNVVNINIEKEMRTSYLDYAMSVIVGRALPDVRDGLKPVHRRVLYTMHEMGNLWNRAYKKSARVVGDVMGKYHPHGDTAIYDTIVRLAQDFNMRHVLVDGQGNFGSIDGDSAAAMRYTEIRMSRISTELLADIEKETVNFVPNYDGSTKEPTVLPSRVPNILVNGSSGIAVGMSTNIPPHNLVDVLNAVVRQIKEPDVSIDELINIVQGPDFPTGGYILGSDGIRSAYKTGRGIIKIRGKVELEEGKREKQNIVITEIPYQVNKSKLIERIADLHRDKKLEGITAIRDESDRTGMRIVIETRKGENADVIINRLYKLTQLSDTFGIIMLALHNGQPKLFNLKDLISAFVDHRKTIIIRRTIFDLRKAEARAHIVEGLLKAIDNIDPIVALIKKSKNPAEAKMGLAKQFDFSDIQAQAILDMRLQRLTGLERSNLQSEMNELKKQIDYLKQLLANDKMIFDLIIAECEEIKSKYGNKRKTEIIKDSGNIEDEDLIQDEAMIVAISNQGYIKRNSVHLYTAQRRGGKGIKGMATNEEDFVSHLFVADTKSFILFFTDLGKVYWLKVHQIPEASRIAKGRAIVNLLNLSKVEKICSVVPVSNFDMKGTIVMATRNGTIKRTDLSAFSNPRSGGIIALTINAGDTLVNAALAEENDDILLCSKEGLSIRFKSSDARSMGRTAAGVKGMELDAGDEVVGMTVLSHEEKERDILSVTELGYGKRTEASEYRVQTRGGKGIITLKTTDKSGQIIATQAVKNDSDLMVISSKGQIVRIRIGEISTMGRNTQGVRLVQLNAGEKVVAVQPIIAEKDEENAAAAIAPEDMTKEEPAKEE